VVELMIIVSSLASDIFSLNATLVSGNSSSWRQGAPVTSTNSRNSCDLLFCTISTLSG